MNNQKINPIAFPGIQFCLVGGKKSFTINNDNNEMIKKIFNAVCKITTVPELDIIGNNRTTKIRQARQIIHYLLRKRTNLSLNKIGETTRNHHCTVLHSIESVEQDYTSMKNYKEMVNRILNEL